ncbi:hypothetical protein HBI56_010580 [Parastagonospora nodorum]|nr:hypothetical protein HBI13_010990 [Parastagonospora nodorum]KAH4042286.1 hypothetical protein HBI09_010930 [Parastagonospora nodorum]KAH4099743.1 hypothetical protein HBH48_011050 [Parastagonospora nodorum]KAH4145843.1 hypothetical protein HBH45_001290 [Parastagonospora nodorum]KAH4213087.1 hypothetical protein HBI95_022590 [Parastagonospora nodorum]
MAQATNREIAHRETQLAHRCSCALAMGQPHYYQPCVFLSRQAILSMIASCRRNNSSSMSLSKQETLLPLAPKSPGVNKSLGTIQQ